jgi:hypothetical protein
MKRKQHPYCKKRIAWRLENNTTTQHLRDFLSMVSIDVPQEVLEQRTPLERAQAEEWASQVHLKASDNSHIRIPPRPEWLAPYEQETTWPMK